MVRAKSGGSNNYNFFRKSIGKAADKRLELLSALHNALEDEGQFRVFYQPKVEVASGKMKDMEALVRWQHPKLGMVSPADFIPLAEDSGLIVPIGEWVLKEACLKTKNWWDAGYTGLQVAVNLSTRQLLEPNLLKSIDAVLAETGLPVGGLALEVTESAFMADVKRSETALRKLHELGIKIFLDDFGTGYSSLSYLRRLPIDSVKIDKSFVDDIPEDPEANELVLSIISMSHSLNLQVTAEGVENQAQLDFLKANNCDYYQGYYFSPALPVEKFNSLFEMRPTARVAHIGG
jgi:EAL domain-containing protein (putative c-di-GMP-specific phosphodiesterase class I)